jgi:hypothetical protein
MKRITLALCAAAFLFACNDGNDAKVASANNTDSTQPHTMPDSATMMKNWQAYMTPGDMHKMMASWDGEWNADISLWMSPGAPPMKSTGVTKNKMVFDGRYQVSEHTGTFDNMPFQGMGTIAYDNAKKTFISTWIDNMGTGIMVLEGPWNESGKSVELRGKMVDPNTGKDLDVREVFRVVDANTQVMEMYHPSPDGKEFKTMEIRYTRTK